MALGRETVGTAYVRILAEGSGLDESIKRQIREADDGVRTEGRRQGGHYAAEFKKGAEHEDIFKGLNANFEKSLARTKMADRFFDSHEWHTFQDKLHDEFGDLGIVAAHELQTEFRHDVNAGFDQATIDIGERMDRIRDRVADAAKGSEEFERRFRESMAKVDQDWAEFDRDFQDHHRHIQKNLDDTNATMHDLAGEFVDGVQRMGTWRAELTKNLGVLGRWGQKMEDSEGFFARFLRDSREAHPVIRRLDKSMISLSNGFGRAFGKGSRNDFLNFIGSVVSGMTRLAGTAISKVAGVLVDSFSQAKKAFNAAQDAGESTFSSLIRGVGAAALAAAELPVTIIAIGVALGALAIAAGPIVGLMSLLLGTVIALTSAITFGLMGALAPLVGLLGPIAVTAGAVAAAFIGIDNKSKKLMKEAIEPLKEDLKALGDAARPGILRGLQTAVENLRQPVRQMGPLFAAAGDGVATFAGAFTDTVTGPGFTKFVDVMTRQLPKEMESLGDIMGHVFDGFLGVLATLNKPGGPVEQFLGWLSGITETFDAWGSGQAQPPEIDLAGGIKQPTAGGTGGFADFMKGIQDSADALMGVLGPLWDIIKQLLNAGKPAGDSLLTSLGNTLTDLSDWMAAHPDDVKQWFEDAKDFAVALGDLVAAFADLVDQIDTPGGRKTMIFLIKLSGIVLTSSAAGIIAMAKALEFLGNIDWQGIGTGLSSLFKHIKNIAVSNVKGLGLTDAVQKAIGKIDISKIISGAGKVLGKLTEPFRNRAKDVLTSIGTFNIVNIIVGLGGVAKAIFDAFPSANDILKSIGTFDIMDVVEGLAGVATSIFNAFPSASEILASIGHIDLGSLMHGSIDPPGPLGPWTWAAGGIADHATLGVFGEAGPEAIVPLNRPLSLVDPAVRGLSAFAQGLTGKPTIDASGWQIMTNVEDPRAVAQEVVNRLVAVGY